ncbi:MAG: DUF550 domain-containing protein [Candidatus Peribacteraceae bacterium]|nr:DUF550 domain-containing protein [Candidatus Peribacteraceae bacterium]
MSLELKKGKVYRVDFSGVQLIARYEKSDTCNHFFSSQLHYWRSYEKYTNNTYCVKAGIILISEASMCEKRCLESHENKSTRPKAATEGEENVVKLAEEYCKNLDSLQSTLAASQDECKLLNSTIEELLEASGNANKQLAASQEKVKVLEGMFDFKAYLEVQRKWSEIVFGHGTRTEAILKHIADESDEVRAEPHDLEEWIDIVILALDGAWWAGYTPEEIMLKMCYKQQKNLKRKWHVPNSENEPVMHIKNEAQLTSIDEDK